MRVVAAWITNEADAQEGLGGAVMSGVQSNAPAMACLATLTLIVYNNSNIHTLYIYIISPKDELNEPKEGKYMSRSFEIKMLFRSLLAIHEAYIYIYKLYVCIYLKRKSAFATCTGLTCRALFNQSRRNNSTTSSTCRQGTQMRRWMWRWELSKKRVQGRPVSFLKVRVTLRVSFPQGSLVMLQAFTWF